MKFLFALVATVFCINANAAFGGGGGSGGGHSFTLGIGYSGATQTDLNSWATNASASGASLTSGYEYSFTYEYRFASSMFALGFRPSYFTSSASANGINNSVTGTVFYPILRIYPLENSFIHFYMQGGSWFWLIIRNNNGQWRKRQLFR